MSMSESPRQRIRRLALFSIWPVVPRSLSARGSGAGARCADKVDTSPPPTLAPRTHRAGFLRVFCPVKIRVPPWPAAECAAELAGASSRAASPNPKQQGSELGEAERCHLTLIPPSRSRSLAQPAVSPHFVGGTSPPEKRENVSRPRSLQTRAFCFSPSIDCPPSRALLLSVPVPRAAHYCEPIRAKPTLAPLHQTSRSAVGHC
ncbi:hypothetical protein VUR80DRAFT_8256 [Thermomyces stellatus]